MAASRGSRGWCFTINNYTEADIAAVQAIKCRYIVVGKEIGENGTPHLQGYIYFDNQRKLDATRRKLGGRCHLEPARASGDTNRTYCVKGGDILREEGDIPKQGNRSDLGTAYAVVKESGSIRKAIDTVECPNFQLIRAVECYSQYYVPQREWKPTVKWFWGKSGAGKTRLAVEEAGPEYWMSSGSLRWWCGYDGHENVILDDFRIECCELNYLLRLLDRYPFRVEVKGGSRSFLAKNIWVTSDRPPNRMWSGRDLEQVLRRIDTVRELKTHTQKSGVILGPDLNLNQSVTSALLHNREDGTAAAAPTELSSAGRVGGSDDNLVVPSQ